MKVKTLVLLSVLFIALGAAGGGAYAFISGENVLAPVAGIWPSPKSSEEKMIDNFIEEQEKKQSQDDGDTPPAEEDKDPQAAKAPDAPTETPQPQNSAVRTGQPTVSDGKTLRVHTTPDLDSEVLLGIPNTEKVEIIDEKNSWYQIITTNGTKGWVSAEYMKEIS